MSEENCDAYGYYKKREGPPDYKIKRLRRVWPEDEEMMSKIRCLDRNHSKEHGLTDEQIDQLEKDINCYSAQKGKTCPYLKQDLQNCIKNNDQLFSCITEMQEFKQCVDKTIKEKFTPKRH